MTLRRPLNVGSTQHEAPEAVWEALVEVDFDPTLSADRMGELQETLWERMEALVQEVLGPHLRDRTRCTMSGLRGRGADTPLFPLVAGGSRYTSNLDVVEELEHAAVPADLRQIAYDARGRAYELDVEIEYLRRPELDGTRRAPMPDAVRVARVNAQRTRTARRIRAPRADA